ncbi:MAG: hypothetical protein Kow0054_11170 [Deferrisoma sp.]
MPWRGADGGTANQQRSGRRRAPWGSPAAVCRLGPRAWGREDPDPMGIGSETFAPGERLIVRDAE